MGFWKNIFPKKPSLNKVLIDIGPDSVAGAYVCYREGEKPTLLSAHRLEIGQHKHEPLERTMLRALHSLGETLIREGAPHVARATGSGAADAIVGSIDAPWASVEMRTKQFYPNEPVIFSEELVTEALSDLPLELDEMLADEEIIGAVLNGYITQEPYGKEASRASIVALASKVRREVAEAIAVCLRNLFHIENISLVSSGSLRHQALRRLFMHEQNAVLLDLMSAEPSLMLLRDGAPVSLSAIPDDWALEHELMILQNRLALPGTLFVLERDVENQSSTPLALPIKTVSVRPSHLLSHVQHIPATPPDLSLLLMALHARSS